MLTEEDLSDTLVAYYKSGYRYQLTRRYEQNVGQAGVHPVRPGGNLFVTLTSSGILIIRLGYAWDGASGPAYNDKSFVRPSLVHDANCQLWELGVIDDKGRAAADRLLGKMLRVDLNRRSKNYSGPAYLFLKTLSFIRPVWVVPAVQIYSRYFAKVKGDDELTAP